jgi:hypothetical protein
MIAFPLLLRAPAGPMVIQLQIDQALAVETIDTGFSRETQADYTFGNPTLSTFFTFGSESFFAEAGIGISFPAFQHVDPDEDLIYGSHLHAPAASGLWNLPRYVDQYLTLTPHYRADIVGELFVLGAEFNLPILIPVGDRREFGGDVEVFMQIALEGGFAFGRARQPRRSP